MTWELNEKRYYWFEGASEENSKYVEELIPGTYEIEVHGAGGSSTFQEKEGSGGYIKISFAISSSTDIDIWVGENTETTFGGWGRSFGGDGGSGNSDLFGGGGGGSTEIINSTGDLIVLAAAGGGSADDGSPFFNSGGGGGGAPGGSGGQGSTGPNGEDAEGIGPGGDGSNWNGFAGDGGQEVGTGLTVIEETTGGRQNPPSEANAPASYDTNNHGWVSIKLVELFVPSAYQIKHYNGTAFEEKPLKYYNGIDWADAENVKRWDGSAWVDA